MALSVQGTMCSSPLHSTCCEELYCCCLNNLGVSGTLDGMRTFCYQSKLACVTAVCILEGSRNKYSANQATVQLLPTQCCISHNIFKQFNKSYVCHDKECVGQSGMHSCIVPMAHSSPAAVQLLAISSAYLDLEQSLEHSTPQRTDLLLQSH